MNLHKQIANNSDCYNAGKTIVVKGLMIHSTGANNKKLSRYVGPDDGILGKNPNGNDWNQPGLDRCVHGWIGLTKDGDVASYQTLPWNHRGWGGGGASNNTHIHVEICEDDLTDKVYFDKVYKEAVELFAYLCKQYKLNETHVITHSEGHKLGIASNHGDVMHWFPKHGKSMDTFRADIKKELGKAVVPVAPATPKPAPVLGKSILDLALEVIEGKHGAGQVREKSLGSAYKAVQSEVNKILQSKNKPAVKTISQLADEVMKGLHGSGRERMLSLGVNYTKVQQEVNKRLRK